MTPDSNNPVQGAPNGKHQPGIPLSKDIPESPSISDSEEQREFLKFRLAQAYRIFGKYGYDEGVAGHITVRDPIRKDCFWVNPWGVHFKLIQPGDLLLVDHNGAIQQESGPSRLLNRAAYMIHSAIHRNRPDVICAAHSHSIYGRAFSTLGIPLEPITQDSCAFYEDHIVYENFKGIVDDKDEGEAIANALGNNKAAILKNHGILVATKSIESAVFFFMSLEKCCRVQMLADEAASARGIPKANMKIDDESARITGAVNGSEKAGWFSGLVEFQLLEHEEGNKYTSRTRSGRL
ncbi:class II aldolase/adducin domain-containing protein [Phlebopus sp. FC_14]|nr:class II aldolase/adducin domain-containing protein [Phlebopus sp. FC_14]